MTSILPIGIGEILSGAIESARLEFKASWDPDKTGHQVLKTLCAFANDLQNLNGGYILMGVAEEDGVAVRPVKGIEARDIAAAQKWIRGNCQRIEPTFMPVFDTPEIDGKRVLVLWAPASDIRPHQAPDGAKGERKYWIRIGSETIEAKGELRTALIQQTARVPFDDRRAFEATNEDLRISLAREFLSDVRSDLVQETDAERVYTAMQITTRQNGRTVPKNIGLLFFTDDPQRWFRGARIEVVEFNDDAGGNTLTEQVFGGPLHHQLRQCLTWLESMTIRHLEKQRNVPETRGWVSFPVVALREALVNAVYHRGYEDVVEPTKVYLYPNRIEIVSYPGPVMGIQAEHLRGEEPVPPVPARNRRIGELLKELRLAEGRGTGLPKIRRSMRDNGSPGPAFDFDEARSYFRVTLPAHPEYIALSVLRDYAYRKATGDSVGARRTLERVWQDKLRSPSVATALIRDYAEHDDLDAARRLIDQLPTDQRLEYARALTAFASALMDAKKEKEARVVLDRLPSLLAAQDAFDAAIAERRVGRQERAHRLFERAGELVLKDVRALHEFAQTKMHLTGELNRSPGPADQEVRRRLLDEAATYLERVLQMDAPPTRHAWAWFDLGRVRGWQHRSQHEVIEAFQRAVDLAPGEQRFVEQLRRVQTQRQ